MKISKMMTMAGIGVLAIGLLVLPMDADAGRFRGAQGGTGAGGGANFVDEDGDGVCDYYGTGAGGGWILSMPTATAYATTLIPTRRATQTTTAMASMITMKPAAPDLSMLTITAYATCLKTAEEAAEADGNSRSVS